MTRNEWVEFRIHCATMVYAMMADRCAQDDMGPETEKQLHAFSRAHQLACMEIDQFLFEPFRSNADCAVDGAIDILQRSLSQETIYDGELQFAIARLKKYRSTEGGAS